MTFKPLFGPFTIFLLSFVTFRVSHFPVSHLTYETVQLGLQNTLNMSKTTRIYFENKLVATEKEEVATDNEPSREIHVATSI